MTSQGCGILRWNAAGPSFHLLKPFKRLSPERHNLIMIPLWDYSSINSENVASITKTLYLVSSPTSNNQSLTQALNCQYPSDLKLRNYSYQTVLIKTARHTQNKANIMPKSHCTETDQRVLRTGKKQATKLLIPFILPQNVFSCPLTHQIQMSLVKCVLYILTNLTDFNEFTETTGWSQSHFQLHLLNCHSRTN